MKPFWESFRLTALCLLAATATVKADDFTYTTNSDNTITITRYIGLGGDVTIPDTIGDLPVTSIMDWSFSKCLALTNITIPNSVTSIGYGAFSYCDKLSHIVIPDRVTSIGIRAFMQCTSLTNVIIGSSVISIEHEAFWLCVSLASITIPDNVISIKWGAFSRCTRLASVTIGNGVTNIEEAAFYYCTNLYGVYFQGNAPSFDSGLFTLADNATAYYLPKTKGWDELFGDRPTALWLPQIQTAGGNLGIQTNGFAFNVTWADGMTVVVEACTNLSEDAWVPVETNTLTGGSFAFSDPDWTNYPNRYYRVSMPQ